MSVSDKNRKSNT